MTLFDFSRLLTLCPRSTRIRPRRCTNFPPARCLFTDRIGDDPRHRSLPRVEGLEGRQLLSHIVTPTLPENAVAGRAANSNLVYTWHETDGQDVVGSMKVKRAASPRTRSRSRIWSHSRSRYRSWVRPETFQKSAIERQTLSYSDFKGTGNFKSPFAGVGPGAAIGVLSIIIPANALFDRSTGLDLGGRRTNCRPPCDQGRGILVRRRLKKEAHPRRRDYAILTTGNRLSVRPASYCCKTSSIPRSAKPKLGNGRLPGRFIAACVDRRSPLFKVAGNLRCAVASPPFQSSPPVAGWLD